MLKKVRPDNRLILNKSLLKSIGIRAGQKIQLTKKNHEIVVKPCKANKSLEWRQFKTEAFFTHLLKPFTKWIGGKRNIIDKLMLLVPKHYRTYYEPFVGGGALLYALHPKQAVINDANVELINAYREVKSHPKKLSRIINRDAKQTSKGFFMRVRSLDRDRDKFAKMSNLERAARVLYLLSTDFNGMWRQNSKGEFNVPYGHYKNPDFPHAQTIKTDSRYFNLANVTMLAGDFQKCVENARRGDFVYFDPPYIPVRPTSSFTSYTKKGFNISDQVRLSDTFFALAKRGVNVMLSNSNTPLTRKLYHDANIHYITANRSVNPYYANGIHKAKEVIITGY